MKTLRFLALPLGLVAFIANAHDVDAESVEQHFSEVNQNSDAYLSQEEAQQAGITDDDFSQMDSDGDGRVSEEEFHKFHGTYGDYDEGLLK